MAITAEQSLDYIKKFDSFLINYSNIAINLEAWIENVLKNWLDNLGYNSVITIYFVEEIVSASGVAVSIVLLIIFYLILRRRH